MARIEIQEHYDVRKILAKLIDELIKSKAIDDAYVNMIIESGNPNPPKFPR
jgi:hypothetical protein